MADETTTSLENALESNRRFQAKVLRELQRLLQEKADNRRLASRVAARLTSTWERLEDASQEPTRPAKQEQLTQVSNIESSATFKSRKSHLKRKWRYNPYRKWTRRFFVDPDGSVPQCNDDTTRRRSLEQGKTFFSRSPPWSKAELERLREIVSRVRTRSGPAPQEHIDFERVAELLNEESKGDNITRTGAECQVKFLQSTFTTPIAHEELDRISELVEKAQEEGNVAWDQVGTSLETNRTAWECFSVHQSKRSRASQWSPGEDELLLKFASAMGPMWVLNLHSAAQMSLRLLPDKSPKQILARAHTSLINPNYVHDVWSNEEERKLALCMKVYRDESSPLVKAAGHFPHRASKSVSEKWNRALDPDLSSKPFTAEEDENLLVAVSDCGKLDWNQISQRFPGRHPRTLANRWAELASHRDFMELCARQGIVRSPVGEAAVSSLSDIVVRIKPETKPIQDP